MFYFDQFHDFFIQFIMSMFGKMKSNIKIKVTRCMFSTIFWTENRDPQNIYFANL